MGYSERVCQLCGISFNIGRIRKPGEPESDAWSSGGRPNTFVTIDEYDSAECSDCQDIPREGATEKEHIAGPNCKLNKGYSGWRIGAEEMRERTWIQCLHQKDDTWVPEAHDEDFEVDAKHCFVTGIGRKGVDEFDAEGFQPVKHGVENCFINSSEEGTDEPWGLPMHPACFEMFKRMSVHLFGTVDIDGLWLLRSTKGDYPRFTGFDERKDVTIVSEQWYYHLPGTEYLAANPVEIPELTRLIGSHTETSSDVVFRFLDGSKVRDPFHVLSPELRAMLLEMLEPRDVANLRLCSKAFSQLPQTYFKHLIRREMPWVWELRGLHSGIETKRGINWFGLWNALSAADGGSRADEKNRDPAGGDGSYSYDEDVKGEIKGMRNRRMIYRDITMILDMIREARVEGYSGQA